MNVSHSGDKRAVLEELLALGMVLVAIDARVPGVDVPDHLGVDPQLRLNLSYRFGRPMQADDWGITAELTFGGVPYPCRFPWGAVFLMVSHVNGEPYLFPDDVPHELLHQAAGEARPSEAAQTRGRPKLSLVRDAEAGADDEQADDELADAGEPYADADATSGDPIEADAQRPHDTPPAPRPRPRAAARSRLAPAQEPSQPAASPPEASDAEDDAAPADDTARRSTVDAVAAPGPARRPTADAPASTGRPVADAGDNDGEADEPDLPPPRRRGHLRLVK